MLKELNDVTEIYRFKNMKVLVLKKNSPTHIKNDRLSSKE
jgi:hypothetical protein